MVIYIETVFWSNIKSRQCELMNNWRDLVQVKHLKDTVVFEFSLVFKTNSGSIKVLPLIITQSN